MGKSELDGDGEREIYYCKVQFSEGVVTDVWDISRMRTNLEDKDCFYSGLDFERLRDDPDRKDNSRLQNLALLAWTSVIPGAHFFCEPF